MQSINEGNIPVNLRRALLKSWHFGHETKTKKERQKYKKNLIFAASRDTSGKKLSELAKENYWDIRVLVAENPNTFTDDLIKLSEDEFCTVCESAKKELERRNNE